MSVDGWQVTKIREITSRVGSGATPKGGQESYHSSGTPLIRSQNVQFNGFREEGLAFLSQEQADELAGATVRGRDVLLNITGASIGRVTVAPEHLDGARVNQHVCIIRPVEGVNPSFLRWFLASPTQQALIFQTQVGATRQALTKEMILNFDVPIPPEEEQNRVIAKVEELFTDLDAGVAELERARANLKRYRAAVLRGAVTGALTEEWRASHTDVEPASKLLDSILVERRRKWEADQLARFAAAGKDPPRNWQNKYAEPASVEAGALPELPAGWCWASVEQLVARSEYGTSVKCDYVFDGLPVLRIPNISQGRLDLGDLKRASREFALGADSALQQGDLLMCRTNGSVSLLGKTAVVEAAFAEPHGFASYLLRFRFVLSSILPSWIHLYCSSLSGRAFIEANAASSAGQHNISLTLMHGMPVPLPPVEEQERIVSGVEEALSLSDVTDKQMTVTLQRAARLRQSILKEAFSGRLVPQDPNDEPVAVLLERIQQERAALSAHPNGQVRRRKPRTAEGGRS